MRPRQKRPYFWGGMTLLWGVGVAVGLSSLWSYASTPGKAAPTPSDWPADCDVTHSGSKPTLVMFAHPKCPCTRASIGELAELATRCGGRVDICVLFFAPPRQAKSWHQTDLWQSAANIPGARVMVDIAGKKCDQFGAKTSGQVLLYDRLGHIVFSGGITEGRGHAGDNVGRSSIESFLLNGAIPRPETAVYGCSLSECADGKEPARW